jgi:hypothetical protein
VRLSSNAKCGTTWDNGISLQLRLSDDPTAVAGGVLVLFL